MNHTISDGHMCQICGIKYKKSEMFPAALVRSTVINQIKTEYPDWNGFLVISFFP